MSGFLWPWVLALLLPVPALIWLYRRWLHPPARAAVVHPDLALLALAGARGRRAPRHLPALLYLGACLLALLALARPTLPVPEAHPGAGIILALDVSLSMQAADIRPNRFEAARDAIRAFVNEVPAGTRIGLVTFAGYAVLAVPLTGDHERILKTVDLLRMDFGTVIGDALRTSYQALPSLEDRLALGDDPRDFATIVLMSDGRNRGGVHPLTILPEVREQRIRVHTVGVGTNTDGPIPGFPTRWQDAARFDEPTLRSIAEETGGRFIFVDSASELSGVYRDLSRSLVWRIGRSEATAFGALAAAALLIVSLALGEFRRRVH